jgi:hypothetical protein
MRMKSALVFAAAIAVLAPAPGIGAEPDERPTDPDAAVESQAAGPVVPATVRENPYSRRPQCASMFLKSDWQLTRKQHVCDWIQNRLFSTTAMAGAAWSAGYSQVTDNESEQGDRFATRFGRKFSQSAFKSTASYLAGRIFREDPRSKPPYLVLQTERRATGFFPRTAQALGRNLISYRCVEPCTSAGHIRKVPAVSRVAGAFASGAASEFWESHGNPDANRVLRGAASAYASSFANAVFAEFQPELNAIAGKTFRALFGGR